MAISGKDFDFSGPGGSLFFCNEDNGGTTQKCGTTTWTVRNHNQHTWVRTSGFTTGGKNVTKVRLWTHDTLTTSYYGEYKGILGLSSTLYNPENYPTAIPSFTYQGYTGSNQYKDYTFNTYYTDLDVDLNPNTTYYMYVSVSSGGAWQAVDNYSDGRYTHYYVEFLDSTQASYAITYNVNGGSGGPGSVTMNWGDGKLSSTKPTRSGYIFKNWNEKQDGSGKSYNPGDSYKATKNATLYAQWTVNVLTVIYNANGGTQASGNSYPLPYTTTENYGKNYNGTDGLWDISSFGLDKRGYTATYWNTNAAGTGYSITQDTSYTTQGLASACGVDLSTGSRTLNFYPKWEARTYKIQYKANGGSGSIESHTATYDSNVTIKSNAFTPPTGHHFTGWTTKSDGTDDGYKWFDSSTSKGWSGTWKYVNGEQGVANGKLILYAMWAKNSYNYTLGTATGVTTTGSTDSGSKEYNSTITLKATPDTGYTWSTWKSSNTTLQSDLATANTTFQMPAGDLTMTPVVVTNGYTIVFNGNGATGGSMNNMTCSYGTTYKLISNGYTRSGYEFLGWSTDSNAATIMYANEASISNLASTNGETITLYAVWKTKSQTFIWAYDPIKNEYRWHRALKYVFTPDTIQNKSTSTT